MKKGIKKRCEGYVRNGGMMTFGPVRWEQCGADATVMIEFRRGKKKEKLPACNGCWKKVRDGQDKEIKILNVEPIE